ncbi:MULTISPECIES: type II secretion system F family protein [Catenuloplanes]|uniref:Tight adherence protein B n=1 Tax=Catenuloplanes niger TaxID=587534 RepID=A0AAE3ZNM2_9ACTN|nr:hypothetical protein [Catenuloplanes niger]MDR7323107.1 tight adherence protein B [Catenuloplanes niger]
MSTFWAAISVLAATVAALAGLVAFRFRPHTGLERHTAPARPGLFAEAAAKDTARTGLPAAFRFDGATGRFTPIDDERPSTAPDPDPAGPIPATPSASDDAPREVGGDHLPRSGASAPGEVGGDARRSGVGAPDELAGIPPRAAGIPARAGGLSEHVDDGRPDASPGPSPAPSGARDGGRPVFRGPVRMPRTRGGQRLLVSAVAGMGALAGLAVAGPVGMLVAVYCRLGIRGVLRREAARSAVRARTRTLDMLCTLAADLRAGLPHTDPPALPDPRIGRLTTAAWRLAERTGAPLADLVERIESDTRAMARGQAAAAAEAAGARATAWLLAALPAGGLVLGAFIGVDPLHVLLHTPIGAACATGAVILQSAGLAWANRLATSGSTP